MVISYSPISKQILKAHIQTNGNYEWVRQNWDSISSENMGKFIAVANRAIVFKTSDFKKLLAFLSEHTDEQTDLIAVRVRESSKVLLL